MNFKKKDLHLFTTLFKEDADAMAAAKRLKYTIMYNYHNLSDNNNEMRL